MTPETTLLILACCATAHFIIAMVLSLYARHQIKYLCLAWIMGIFAAALTLIAPLSEIATGKPGMLHPAMLMGLLAICYLQSIYPLSIPMPGYLQWGRMWKYASPILVLLFLYTFAYIMGSRTVIIENLGDLRRNLLTSDILMRIVSMMLGIGYIVNIFRLPRRLTHVEFPRYLIGYCMVLGLSAVYYVIVTIIFDPVLLMGYIIIFTLLNLYLFFRTLESMALELPKPQLPEVEQAPTEEELRKAEEDFNEANRQRFQRAQYWMQQNPSAWQDYTFGRDRLCEKTGINRHLMLQCMRSQGFNNIHDYINSYRINALKKMIIQGRVTTLTECQDAGFGTVKTAKACFLKHEGSLLEEFLAQHNQNAKSK